MERVYVLEYNLNIPKEFQKSVGLLFFQQDHLSRG